MAKTEKILKHLPDLYGKFDRRSLLYWMMDVFGQRMQEAENDLVEVMKTHWIDYAEDIKDLALIGSLYGVKTEDFEIPGSEDDENLRRMKLDIFKHRLKDTIQAYLEGGGTLRAVWMLTKASLGVKTEPLKIPSSGPVKSMLINQANSLIFGTESKKVTGRDGLSASIKGTVDLSSDKDLRIHRYAKVIIDKYGPREPDCSGDNPASTTLDEVCNKINQAFPEISDDVASHDGTYVTLTSPTTGPEGKVELQPRCIEIIENPEKNAEFVTPLLKNRDRWLMQNRGIAPAVPEITIYAERPMHGPILFNMDTGVVINFLVPLNKGDWLEAERAPKWANSVLFGKEFEIAIGSDNEPAKIIGQVNLKDGVNLSGERFIRLKIDSRNPKVIDCSGETPESTAIDEICERINELFPGVASIKDEHENKYIVLTSPIQGTESRLELQKGDYLTAQLICVNGKKRVLELNETLIRSPGSIIPITVPAPLKIKKGQDSASLQLVDPLSKTVTELRAILPGEWGGKIKVKAIASASGIFNRTSFDNAYFDGVESEFYDVVLEFDVGDGIYREDYLGVKLSSGGGRNLLKAINEGLEKTGPSSLVRATDITLILPPGGSRWLYGDCLEHGRFNESHFNQALFGWSMQECPKPVGNRYISKRVFDSSILSQFFLPEFGGYFDEAYFDFDNFGTFYEVSSAFLRNIWEEPRTKISFKWKEREVATFKVNLPYRLPSRFGGYFDEASFNEDRFESREEKLFKSIQGIKAAGIKHIVTRSDKK